MKPPNRSNLIILYPFPEKTLFLAEVSHFNAERFVYISHTLLSVCCVLKHECIDQGHSCFQTAGWFSLS